MRLDHLLSKEHLQARFPCMRGVWFVRSKGPLRRRSFCGGCSWVEYQQIGAWWHGPLVSTDRFLFGGLVLERWWFVVAG